jgi:hypothetical protein
MKEAGGVGAGGGAKARTNDIPHDMEPLGPKLLPAC